MPPRIRLERIGSDKPIVDTAKLLRGLERAVDDTTAIVESNFKATTKTWRHKVRFKRRKAARRGNVIEGDVTTDDEIYGYVTGGTRRHLIPKRPLPQGRSLRFRGGKYGAKTRPRVLGSHKGGAGGAFVFRKQVMHPGTKAREFEQEIALRRQRNLHNFVIRAYAEARK